MAAVLDDPRSAVDAITHQSEQQAKEQVSVQEQHAPGTTPSPVKEPEKKPDVFEKPLSKEEILRPAFGALATTLGAAFLTGGMFVGFSPRIYAAIGGIAGVALAVIAARAQKRATLIQILTFAGILFVGLLLLSFSDFGAVGRLGHVLGEATKNARLRRPPAPFDLGWKAILPWTVGLVGYSAAWIGSVGRKPAIGVLIPMPIIAFSAIAQPSEAQVPAGIVAFVTFVVGLTVIYRADRGEGEGVSTAYELKRAMRAAPLVVGLIVALFFLAQTNLLFPAPLYDPTEKAQKPRAVNVDATDRVLFATKAPLGFTGPWRLGVLDVYDGEDWRLPPYNSAHLKNAPTSGFVDKIFEQEVVGQLPATINVGGLEGTGLPLPARTHGIRGTGLPQLVVDKRNESVRVKEGQVAKGVSYDVTFALLPSAEELQTSTAEIPLDIKKIYLDVSGRQMPPAVKTLLDDATAKTKNLWDRLDYMRQVLLDKVIAKGTGLPGAIPPSKINDMVEGGKANPYEIVAAQAVIARWIGVPSRIGFGFDAGEKNAKGEIEFHPKNGAAWLEVYWPRIGWFPVTGYPKHAELTLDNGDKNQNAKIIPSEQIAVRLLIPLRVRPANALFKQIQYALLLASPFIVAFLLVWLLWPVVFKARRRSRRREWALQQARMGGYGRQARIAVAYAELRDIATDLGVGDPYGTPLAYVSKVVPDEEHRELAWLVTRTLWGDLREGITDDEVFAAEELSRSLRRRMFEAQPFTIRGIALVSRLSLRNPYAPELLSPPVERLELGRRVRALVPKLRPRLPRRAREREMPDEAVENA